MKYPENERFRNVLNYLLTRNIIKNKSDFAKKVGKHPQIIYDILADKLKISNDLLLSLENDFGINKMYILFGEGEMLKEKSPLNMACEPVQPYTKLDYGKNRSKYNEREEMDYDVVNDSDNDLIIKTLQEQLRSKDEQLRAKDEQINKLLELLTKK